MPEQRRKRASHGPRIGRDRQRVPRAHARDLVMGDDHVTASRPLRVVFVDANPALAAVADELLRAPGLDVAINRDPDVRPAALPGLLDGADVAIVDHTSLP